MTINDFIDPNQIMQQAQTAVVIGALIVSCTLAFYLKRYQDQW